MTNKSKSFQKSGSFETGISDHHHLIYSMFKSNFKKVPPQVIEYRSFKNFVVDDFRKDLSYHLNCEIPNFEFFNSVFESVLDAHAPKKKRTIRGNQKSYMTKALRKAIMIRSSLKSRANRTGNPNDYDLYRRQRNLVVNLNRNAKKDLFSEFENLFRFLEIHQISFF